MPAMLRPNLADRAHTSTSRTVLPLALAGKEEMPALMLYPVGRGGAHACAPNAILLMAMGASLGAGSVHRPNRPFDGAACMLLLGIVFNEFVVHDCILNTAARRRRRRRRGCGPGSYRPTQRLCNGFGGGFGRWFGGLPR